jgi:hypothetical protein
MTRTALVGLIIVGLVLSVVFVAIRARAELGSGPLLGYAWSETVGWVDLNCQNSNTCTSIPWGFSVDNNGMISGYAWSENVGWLSANAGDLSGCPSAPCTANISASNFHGWLKALSGGSAQSGGWDGFVSLSGPGYGVSIPSGNFSGYAWGSTVIGWLDFAWVVVPQCSPIYTCSGNAVHNSCTGVDTPCQPDLVCAVGACIPAVPPSSVTFRVTPTLVRSGESVQVAWSATNVISCSVSEDSPNINDAWTGISDTKTSSPISQRTTYTLSCITDTETITRTGTVNIVPMSRER